jgi:hypothetical protein
VIPRGVSVRERRLLGPGGIAGPRAPEEAPRPENYSFVAMGGANRADHYPHRATIGLR